MIFIPPIQGATTDLIEMTMININTRLIDEGFRTRMLIQVHDGLVFEVPEDEIDVMQGLIVKEMEDVYKLDVPLKVDSSYGKNWDEAH